MDPITWTKTKNGMPDVVNDPLRTTRPAGRGNTIDASIPLALRDHILDIKYCVDSFPALRAVVGEPGQAIHLRCRDTLGDRGGGVFVWSATVQADDGGTVANAGAGTSAGWRRLDADPWDYDWFGDLARIITAAGTDDRTVVIGPHTLVPVTANATVPDNIHLQVHRGGGFVVSSGKVLTIKGSMDPVEYQIFFGAGSVVGTSDGKMSVVRPEMWGAKGDVNLYLVKPDFEAIVVADLASYTDDTAAFEGALAFFGSGHSTMGGTLLLRPRTYKISAGLTWPNGVRLQGAVSKKRNGWQSTALVFTPGSPTKDLLTMDQSAADDGYGIAHAEHISFLGVGAYAGTGLHLLTTICRMKNVDVQGFAVGMKIDTPINSTFDQCFLIHNACNMWLTSTASLGMTCAFRECYFQRATGSPSVRVDSQCEVVFSNCTIESNLGDAVWLDGVATSRFIQIHFENNAGHLFKVGATTLCRKFTAHDMQVIGGPSQGTLCLATDIFHLDRVNCSEISISAALSGPKAAIIRATANTGRIIYGAAGEYDGIISSTPSPRVADHLYHVGDAISVTEVANWGTPRTLTFICVAEGTSAAGGGPDYHWGDAEVTDGTAKFSHQTPYALPDARKLIRMGSDDSPFSDGFQSITTPSLRLHGNTCQSQWEITCGQSATWEEFSIGEAARPGLLLAAPVGSTYDGKVTLCPAAGVGDYSTTHRVLLGNEMEVRCPAGRTVPLIRLDATNTSKSALAANGDLEVTASSKGLILVDTTNNHRYRLTLTAAALVLTDLGV